MGKRKLTVLITTYNEASNIEAILENTSFADEQIVVDSFSEDNTLSLAQKYTDKVYTRKYIGPADQKNWAIPLATYEWVLILDADERVSPALRDEIQSWLDKPQIPFDAFWIKRQNHFMGQKVKYSGWQNDAVIRLIHRDTCRYDDKQVHEEIEDSNLRVSHLKSSMIHYTYQDIDHFLDKTRRYAKWSALDHKAKTQKVTWFHLLIKPGFRFFKHFILQKGFLDGKTGLIVSSIMAWGVFLRYLYLRDELKD